MRPPFAFQDGVDVPSTTPEPQRAPRTDLRRAISRQAWLTSRARNALHRPAFIGAISIGTFVLAIVSLFAVPSAQERAELPIATVARPDTLTLAAAAAMARVQLISADSALTAARLQAEAEAARLEVLSAQALAVDTVAAARRDSLAIRLRALEMMISRAAQAPLPSSYRALAEMPDLRNDTRVRSLVDSLNEVERERDSFGAVGGVDPIFVALTSRANEIGRAIQDVAARRRDALRTELATAEAPPVPVIAVATIDTLTPIAMRDSARATLDSARQQLVELRAVSRRLDLEEREAREAATAVAPPLALLAAAFVLSAVIGFAAALFGELRRPRVSTAQELERFLGVRVLSSVESTMPSMERGRRKADRAAPPYFDPSAEGYQLAYLALATGHPALLSVTVSGDDHTIAAVVGCNLAAVAADEARNTLVLDLVPTASASAALRARTEPGITDVVRGDQTWPDVTVPAQVGRDKTVDLVPYGASPASDDDVAARLRQDVGRHARYYDALVAIASSAAAATGMSTAMPSPEVLYCVQPGITPLYELRAELERIRASGGVVRGIVLWSAERPMLVDQRPQRGRRAAPSVPKAAAMQSS